MFSRFVKAPNTAPPLTLDGRHYLADVSLGSPNFLLLPRVLKRFVQSRVFLPSWMMIFFGFHSVSFFFLFLGI